MTMTAMMMMSCSSRTGEECERKRRWSGVVFEWCAVYVRTEGGALLLDGAPAGRRPSHAWSHLPDTPTPPVGRKITTTVGLNSLSLI